MIISENTYILIKANMVVIITADVINSESYKEKEWLPMLKGFLKTIGTEHSQWELYRGDEFQLKMNKEQGLQVAIMLKSLMKTVTGLDVRIAIGLGEEEYFSNKIGESNGPVYKRSGRLLELLKHKKTNLVVDSGNADFDAIINLMLSLALDFMDSWTSVSAEIVFLTLTHPNWSQAEMATHLNIAQSAVSQRLKRSKISLVLELLNYYTKAIKKL